MTFTALHRALGREPGPVTDEMLDEAVQQGVEEQDQLDWKRALPDQRELATSDLAKDVAAMANSGGGVIVYGVTETAGRADGRVDVGEVSESYERTMRRVASSAIQPPVVGLGIHRLGTEPERALVVVVPASVESPHLVYRGEYFGAPVRNHADTEWMRERQLEAMYRARFEERRASERALVDLYEQVLASRGTSERAWMIGVARPRLPIPLPRRMTRAEATAIFVEAYRLAPAYSDTNRVHPIEDIDRHNPRPGLRRWVARPAVTGENYAWKESWATVHDDGSATLAAAVGGARSSSEGHDPGWIVASGRAERFTADLAALVRASAAHHRADEFEVRLGIEWTGPEPLQIQTVDNFDWPLPDISVPLARYTPVVMSMRAAVDEATFRDQLCGLAEDVVNQGGVQNLRTMRRTEPEPETT